MQLQDGLRLVTPKTGIARVRTPTDGIRRSRAKNASPASLPAGLEVWSGLTGSKKDPPSGTGVGAVPSTTQFVRRFAR